ncbi:MAG TPA: hypothetical protein VIK82_05195 [Porticoccaceae bacterium]
MIASLVLPGQKPITLGEVSTLSYSIYREKNAVRTLGRISVKGFTKGPRTVAGTIIFTVFDRHVVNRLREQVEILRQAGRLKSDELPPFDLIVTGANEFGSAAAMRIYGVTVIEEGMTVSVEDIFTENIWQYQARDIRLLDNYISEDGQLPVTEEPARTQFRDGADMSLGFFTLDKLEVARMAEKYSAGLEEIWKQKLAEKQAREDMQRALQEMLDEMQGKIRDPAGSGSSSNSDIPVLNPPKDGAHLNIVVEIWGKTISGGQEPINAGITGVKAYYGWGGSAELQHVSTNRWKVENIAALSNMPIYGKKVTIDFEHDSTNPGLAQWVIKPIEYQLTDDMWPTAVLKAVFERNEAYDRQDYVWNTEKDPETKVGHFGMWFKYSDTSRWSDGYYHLNKSQYASMIPDYLVTRVLPQNGDWDHYPKDCTVYWFYAVARTPYDGSLGPSDFKYVGQPTTLTPQAPYLPREIKFNLKEFVNSHDDVRPGYTLVLRMLLKKPGMMPTTPSTYMDHWDFFFVID